MANTSSAYDYSLFERKQAAAPALPVAPQKKQQNLIRLNTQQLTRSRRHNANVVRTMLNLCVTLVVVGAIGAIVFSQVQLTELTDQVNSTSTTLSEQQSLEIQLEMMASSKMNTDQVETYAREKLGMEKVTDGQTTYINLAQQDSGTVVQADTEPGVLEGIWKSILSFFS